MGSCGERAATAAIASSLHCCRIEPLASARARNAPGRKICWLRGQFPAPNAQIRVGVARLRSRVERAATGNIARALHCFRIGGAAECRFRVGVARSRSRVGCAATADVGMPQWGCPNGDGPMGMLARGRCGDASTWMPQWGCPNGNGAVGMPKWGCPNGDAPVGRPQW